MKEIRIEKLNSGAVRVSLTMPGQEKPLQVVMSADETQSLARMLEIAATAAVFSYIQTVD